MKRILLLILLWLSAFPITAQSIMDRAEKFSYDSLSRLVLNDYATVEWLGGRSDFFRYKAESKDGEKYYIVNTKTWKRQQFPDYKSVKAAADSIVRGGRS